LFHLLRCDGKDVQDLGHDPHEYLLQFNGRRTLNIDLEALEEVFDLPKEVNERIVARLDTLCRLSSFGIKRADRQEQGKIRTERRTLIPVTIAFAGGNACTITSE